MKPEMTFLVYSLKTLLDNGEYESAKELIEKVIAVAEKNQ